MSGLSSLNLFAATQSQAQSPRSQLFTKLDKDSNSKLSLEEFTQGLNDKLQNLPGNPGSKAALQAAWDPAKKFAQIDTNQDGSLTEEEFAAFKPKLDTETQNALFELLSKMLENSRAESSHKDKKTNPLDPQNLFAKIDTNGDGSITKDELTATIGQLKFPPASQAHADHQHDHSRQRPAKGTKNPLSQLINAASLQAYTTAANLGTTTKQSASSASVSQTTAIATAI